MKKINLRDYYPYYTQDMIVEVPDEVALLLREYMLLEPIGFVHTVIKHFTLWIETKVLSVRYCKNLLTRQKFGNSVK